MPAARAADIIGARANTVVCDNVYFNTIGGSKIARLDKFVLHADHQEKADHSFCTGPGQLAGTESDASTRTLLFTTEVTPTGHDNGALSAER